MQNPKPKIVRIIARLNTGGPARHVVWLADGLRDDFNTELVCGSVPSGEGDMSYFAAEYDVEPFIIEEMSRELSPRDIISLWKLYRKLLREKPAIIHTHTAKAGTLGRIAGFSYKWFTPQTLIGKPRRVKFVHTYHGHVFHSYYGKLKTRFFLAIEQVLAKLATDKIIVLSEQQRREINEQFKVGKPKQFEIIGLGVDLQPFENWQNRRHILRDEINAAPDEILIGLVGRLTEVKNHSLFLQIAKIWQERESQNPRRIRFLIIGDGHLRGKLEAEASSLNLSNVTFMGERKDAQNFYPALDVVALTSLNEGTPLSLIEAMANERATISTAVGGTIDLLGAKNGLKLKDDDSTKSFQIVERGILVASEDAESFYQGLRELLMDDNLRKNFGQRGKTFVYDNYSRERLISDIKRLYQNLLMS